jgi:site-specific DNA recombinase
MSRAIVYCRVSTTDQADHGTSLDSQERACLEYAASQGWEVARVVKEDHSGMELTERVGLMSALRDIEQRKAGRLLCYVADRMSRHQTHSLIIFDRLTDADAELWFVRHGKIEDSPIGRAMLTIYATGAALEHASIRERTMRGRRSRLLEGKPTFVGEGLYGYRNDKQNNRWVINQSEALIVERVFTLCLRGFGASAIAHKLNHEGVPSPKGHLAKWKGRGHWCQAAIYNMLRNSSYCGVEFKMKTERVRGKTKKRPQSEWIRLPDGLRPAIVSVEVWRSAQEILNSNTGATKRNERRPVLLRGYLFCGACNRGMHLREHERYGKGINVYRCNSRFKVYDTGCDGEPVPYAEMNEWIWGEIKKHISDPTLIEMELMKLSQVKAESKSTSELKAARRELDRIEQGISALLRRFRDADESLWPMVEREIAQAGNEKKLIESRIAQLESEMSKKAGLIKELHTLKEYCERVKGRLEHFTFADKRLAFEALGVRVFASGRDSARWWYEINWPVSSGEHWQPPAEMFSERAFIL